MLNLNTSTTPPVELVFSFVGKKKRLLLSVTVSSKFGFEEGRSSTVGVRVGMCSFTCDSFYGFVL